MKLTLSPYEPDSFTMFVLIIFKTLKIYKFGRFLVYNNALKCFFLLIIYWNL